MIAILSTLLIVIALFALDLDVVQFSRNKPGIEKQEAMDKPQLPDFEMLKNGVQGASPEKGDIDIKVIGQLKSGQITTLPWEQDADFLQAKEELGAEVLMAGYRTVLVDPLPGEEYNVHLAATMLSGRVIAPGQIFSQNRELGPYDESKGFREGPTYIGSQLVTTIGGGVCKISSTLYNVAVLSNLEIIQRYNHSMPVPYVPYGQDATVSYGSRDFQFKNNTSFPILVWAEAIGNTLYIAFYGKEQPPKVEWYHEIMDIQEASTIYKTNPNLAPGIERILIQGMDGATVKSRITITWPDGRVETKDMGTSYYRPMPSIVERNQ